MKAPEDYIDYIDVAIVIAIWIGIAAATLVAAWGSQ